jgi:phage terminase small subunit
MGLTAKQQTFVNEYLIDLNATQAAIRAGYSEQTARVTGGENLTKPAIAEAIAKAQAERAERTQIDADWVLRELKRQYEKADTGSEINTALSALEKIGKHNQIQAFVERIANLNEPPQIVINRPSGD